MDSNDRSKHVKAGFADCSAEPALFFRFQKKYSKNILHKFTESMLCTFAELNRVHSVTKKALKSLHFPTKYAIITARE